MQVVELNASRGLWSAYLDDGAELGEGAVEAKTDTCKNIRYLPDQA